MTSQDKTPLTKDDAVSWFTARQEANRKRRETKMTAADVEARLGGLRAAKPLLIRTVPAVLGAGMLIAACFIALGTTSGSRSFTAQQQSFEVRIHSAKGELATIPASEPASATSFSETLAAQLDVARSAGKEVAQLQQEYASILFEMNGTTSPDGTAPKGALEAAVAHQASLAGYFTPESLGADDGIDDGEIDPRYPWFVGYEKDGVTVVDPTTSMWQLASVETTDADGVFQASWVNVDGAGDLHAWATASYQVDSETFGRFTVGKSTVANSAVQAGM